MMSKNPTYNIKNTVSAEEIKYFRHNLGLSQSEFSKLLGVSRPTVERMETNSNEIRGPIAIIIDLLTENMEIIENRIIPLPKYALRMWYMYKNKKCTLIDVDDLNRKIFIKNYTDKIMYTAFGTNTNPNYEDYCDFLKSRCFPETRDKIKIQLEALQIPFYDPMLIIEKTQGRMAEDDFWILIERN